jgi:hypothetical protein
LEAPVSSPAVGEAPPQAAPVAETSAAPALPATPARPASTAPAAPAPDQGPDFWRWLTLGAATLVGLGSVIAWRRRRRASAPPRIVTPQLDPAPLDPALALAVEAVRMDRSVLNATVGYRVTLRNRSGQALTGVSVEADLVSASGNRPAEQQLASPAQALTPRHSVDRIAPGQSLRFDGQVRLPLSEATAIWQGRAALLVPLLRVRATAEGAQPVATTLVIGRAEGQAARPQPFRLDEPPRSYAPLAQRVLDAAPARA